MIDLPPIFAASPGVTIDTISRYDDKGPAWYWNTFRFGESLVRTKVHLMVPASTDVVTVGATVAVPRSPAELQLEEALV